MTREGMPLSASDFIRSQPTTMTAPEIVAAGREQKKVASICDRCSCETDEPQDCELCGGTFCERHIGEFDHSCTEDKS